MTRLILEGRKVHSRLVDLATLTRIDVSPDVDLETMEHLLQTRWFQQIEHIKDITGVKPSNLTLDLLESLGCVDEVNLPFRTENFGAVLVPGATVNAMRNRIAHLARQELTGLTDVHILTSKRKRDEKIETPEALFQKSLLSFKPGWKTPTELPNTEAAIARMIIDQSILPSHWKVSVMECEGVVEDGKTRNANTADTYQQWYGNLLNRKGRSTSVLIASQQPYFGHQIIRAIRDMPAFRIVGIGPAANPNLPFKTYLQTLAKQFHEELFLWQKSLQVS